MSKLRLVVFSLSFIVLLGTTFRVVSDPTELLPQPPAAPATGCDAFADLLAQVGHPNTPTVEHSDRPVLDPLSPRHLRTFHYAMHTLFLDVPVAQMTAWAGFDSVVQVFPWRDLNPAPGVYTWNAADDMVRVANKTGLDLVVRLDMPPEWAIVDEGPLPFDLSAYADFVEAVARRYRGRVLAYVVWNEPNLAVEWGRGVAEPWVYVGVLGAAYRRIRVADPGALVVAAGPGADQRELGTGDGRPGFLAGDVPGRRG